MSTNNQQFVQIAPERPFRVTCKICLKRLVSNQDPTYVRRGPFDGYRCLQCMLALSVERAA